MYYGMTAITTMYMAKSLHFQAKKCDFKADVVLYDK